MWYFMGRMKEESISENTQNAKENAHFLIQKKKTTKKEKEKKRKSHHETNNQSIHVH